MNLIKSMTGEEAMAMINYYVAGMNYPTFPEFYNVKSAWDIKENVKMLDSTYLEAVLIAGEKYYNLKENDNDRWLHCATYIREELEKRSTRQYKQDYFNRTDPGAVRTMSADKENQRKNMSLTMAPSTGDGKKDKKQMQLNLERMEHIKALERSISTNDGDAGALRRACDTTYGKYKDRVNNMVSDEEAKKLIENEKKKMRPIATVASLLVMPFYTLARGLEFITNPFVFRRIKGENALKVGFFALPAIVSCFIALAVTMVVGFTDSSTAVFNCFLPAFFTTFLAIVMLREVLGIPFVFLRKGMEYITEAVAYKFEVEEDHSSKQIAPVNEYLTVYNTFKREFEAREDLIKQLRNAIETNLPYTREIDDLRKKGRHSIAELNAEENRKNNRRAKEQKKIAQKG